MSYLVYFPENNDAKSGRLKKLVEVEFRKKDKKKHRRLKLELYEMDRNGESYILRKLDDEKHYSHNNKTIANLGDGLYELRIPKQSKTGVFRVYFVILYDGRILILDAEYKTEKEAKRLEPARKKLEKLREVGIYVKGSEGTNRK